MPKDYSKEESENAASQRAFVLKRIQRDKTRKEKIKNIDTFADRNQNKEFRDMAIFYLTEGYKAGPSPEPFVAKYPNGLTIGFGDKRSMMNSMEEEIKTRGLPPNTIFDWAIRLRPASTEAARREDGQANSSPEVANNLEQTSKYLEEGLVAFKYMPTKEDWREMNEYILENKKDGNRVGPFGGIQKSGNRGRGGSQGSQRGQQRGGCRDGSQGSQHGYQGGGYRGGSQRSQHGYHRDGDHGSRQGYRGGSRGDQAPRG